jgi:hypothetical protein
MLWLISNVNKSNIDAAREAVRQAHRDYLDSKRDILVLSGATLSDDGSQSFGSTFLLNVRSREEAVAFSINEPITKAGLYASTTITRMRKSRWNPQAAEAE